jgi:methylenetetrahydrofolate reductase (NADPH)
MPLPSPPTGQEALARALAHPRFELVPIRGVDEQAGLLPRGATVTVTNSPKRGNENTLEVAERLAKLGLHVVPHISARLVADRRQLREILRRLADLDLHEIFVVGGDAPAPTGVYESALDLLRDMAHLGHELTEIGVAAYPEGHPLVDDETLLWSLQQKQRFATYLVTQITFDPKVIGRWLGAIRPASRRQAGSKPGSDSRQGIVLPAYIGVPGVVDTARLLQISMRIGVGQSMRFLTKHTSLASRLLRRGGYQPDALIEGLAPYFRDPEYGIAGLHINTFNQVERTEEWRRLQIKERVP